MPGILPPSIGCTGRLPTPPDVVARYRLHLARASRLAEFHASQPIARAGGTGLLGTTVTNSSTLITSLGTTGLGAKGNNTYYNCISAALAHGKQIVTTRTGATLLDIPEGGNPYSTDNPWGTVAPPNVGPTSAVPANAPGVIAWSQANNCLGMSYISSVLGALTTAGTWPHGGMVDAAGGHHLINGYGSFDWTNQNELVMALQYFKYCLIGMGGNSLLALLGGNRFLSGAAVSKTDNHCFCLCDCGPASQFVTSYGLTLPSGLASTAFCVGGISWGCFFAIDWTSFQNLASEGWVVTSDPDRGDASTFNPMAAADYQTMLASPTAAMRYAEQMLCS